MGRCVVGVSQQVVICIMQRRKDNSVQYLELKDIIPSSAQERTGYP